MSMPFGIYVRWILITLFFLTMVILVILNNRMIRKVRSEQQSFFSILPVFRGLLSREAFLFVVLVTFLAGLGFAISKLPH